MNVVAITQQNKFFNGGGCTLDAGNNNNPNQGILGVGPQDLTLPGTDDFISKLAAVSGLPEAYAVQLCDRDGAMWLGGYNPNAVTQAPTYAPMLPISTSSSPYYAVQVNSMMLGNTKIGDNNALGPVTMDTGTSALILPSSVFDALQNALNSNSAFRSAFGSAGNIAGQCVSPANGASRAQLDSQLPPLVMNVDDGNGGSLAVTLPATRSYLLPMSNSNSHTAEAYCFMAEQGGGSFPTIWGNTAMRSLVVVFDVGGKRIGFAPQQNCAVDLA